MNKTPVPFVCVLRSGGSYGATHVLRLAEAIRRFNPDAQLICFTDIDIPDPSIPVIALKHGLPGWFSKLEVFTLVDRPFLYVDLDVVITGSIHIELDCGLYLLRGFSSGAVNSSVMYVDGDYRHVLDRFMSDPKGYQVMYSAPERWGDQDFIRDFAVISGFLQDVSPGLAASWKRDLNYQLGKIFHPPKILVFHGEPKPESLWIRSLPDGGVLIFSVRYFLKYLMRRLRRGG